MSLSLDVILTLIHAAFAKSYVPSDFDEGFMDKVGVLGSGIFFDMFNRWPDDYSYDDSFGVRIKFTSDGIEQEVYLNPKELSAFPQGKEPDLFYVIEHTIREKFKLQPVASR